LLLLGCNWCTRRRGFIIWTGVDVIDHQHVPLTVVVVIILSISIISFIGPVFGIGVVVNVVDIANNVVCGIATTLVTVSGLVVVCVALVVGIVVSEIIVHGPVFEIIVLVVLPSDLVLVKDGDARRPLKDGMTVGHDGLLFSCGHFLHPVDHVVGNR
jgi:hypothetical protein